MYSFSFIPNDLEIVFLAYGPGYYSSQNSRAEDTIDEFWNILADQPISYYGKSDGYERIQESKKKVLWLLKRGIHFTVESICVDKLLPGRFVELVKYKINIPDRNDALIFRLSCPYV
jgi:hypothetical protein